MMRTSLIAVNSSTHGRERRNQRDITKRDLQAAVKYGKKEKGFPNPRTREPRWKYTYADIVYITDSTSTREVTSWATEIEINEVEIPNRRLIQYREAKNRIDADPSIITSHTVLIVDKSASMKKSDMNGHKTRARGVYFSLAEEFVLSQLDSIDSNTFSGNHISFTDVVTLIEMRTEPTIVFKNEPITWQLYNKFVEISKRQDAYSHGNYYESFVQAFDCLSAYDHPTCALSLFFLTDGKPSDLSSKPYSGFPHNLTILLEEKCGRFGQRFNFTAVGYGAAEADFLLLKELVDIQ